MTDQELQEAIERAREFMNLASPAGSLLYKAREHTQAMLKELEKIQVIRAGMATQPMLANLEET